MILPERLPVFTTFLTALDRRPSVACARRAFEVRTARFTWRILLFTSYRENFEQSDIAIGKPLVPWSAVFPSTENTHHARPFPALPTILPYRPTRYARALP